MTGVWGSEVYEKKTFCVRTPAATARNVGSGAPSILELPFTIAQQMTVDNDFLTFKYYRPVNFVHGTALDFRLNWTKSQVTDQSGNKVKWKLEYLFVDIGDDVADATPDGTLYSEQTYSDEGTTERLAYSTSTDLTITSENVQEDKPYLYIKVAPVASSAPALIEPALLSVRFDYLGYGVRYPYP